MQAGQDSKGSLYFFLS